MAKLEAFEAAEVGDIEYGEPVVGDPGDVARVVDDQHRHLRKADGENVLEVLHVLGQRVVDEDDQLDAMRLDGGHGLDGRREVGAGLIGQRHDGDVGHLRRFDDAALDKAAEVDDQRFTLAAIARILERLPRLQRDDTASRQRRLVDIGGAVVEVVGDEDCASMLGVADGVGGLTLPSFDRVKEHGHSAIVIG